MSEDCLDAHTRAEDILLGSLGIAEDARVLSVERTSTGYRGRAAWADGEEFDFESEEELGELEMWALEVLNSQGKQ